MAKITECSGCPEPTFDPRTLKPGYRTMYQGLKCLVTNTVSPESICGYTVVVLQTGEVCTGYYPSYEKPTTPWLLED